MHTWARNPSGDILLPLVGSGQSAIVTDPLAAAQLVIQDRLRFFLGEWAFDQSQGFPWLTFAGQRNPSTAALASAIRAYVLETEGVVSVDDLSVTFNPQTRHIAYSGQARFDTGASAAFGNTGAAVSPSPPFLLTQVPGLLAWYVADQGITLDSSGLVSQWTDISGNMQNVAQATPANRPGYNAIGGPLGRGTVLYSGSPTLSLFGAFPAVAQPFEAFVVARTGFASHGTNDFLLDFGTDNCALLRNVSANAIAQFNGINGSGVAIPVNNTPFVVDAIFNASSSTIALNGGAPTSAGALSGAGGSGNIVIGDTGVFNQAWRGEILEVAVFETTLGSVARAQVIAYFRRSWGF